MYKSFYGLEKRPFNTLPDPDFLYMSEKHKSALSHIEYGLNSEVGFVLLTGEIGSGKTTLINYLLKKYESKRVKVAFIFYTNISPRFFLKAVLKEWGIECSKDDKDYLLNAVNNFLIEEQRNKSKVILIIDEAQNLPFETIEEIRILSNLTNGKHPLVNTLLSGQPNLIKNLNNPAMEQFRQRLAVHYHLTTLDTRESALYIQHRLKKASSKNPDLFLPDAMKSIYDYSGGIPRLINLICDTSLLYGYARGQKSIDKSIVDKAVADRNKMGIGIHNKLKIPEQIEKPGSVLDSGVISHRKKIPVQGKSIKMKEDFSGSAPTETKPEKPAVQKPVPTINAVIDKKEYLKKTTVSHIKHRNRTFFRPAHIIMASLLLITSAIGLLYLKSALPPADKLIQSETSVADKKNPAIVELPDTVSSAQSNREKEIPLVKTKSPDSPQQAFHVPKNKYFLAGIPDKQQAFVWQGSDSKPMLRAKINFDWMLGDGLFFLAEGQNKEGFAFKFDTQIQNNSPVVSSNLWKTVSSMVSQKVVPLIVYSPETKHSSNAVKTAKKITGLIDSWADAWRHKDPAGFAEFYADNFTVWDTGRSVLFSKKQLLEHKKTVFAKCDLISLNISAPICIIDPANPGISVAFFYQKYESETYSDEGTKILCFNLINKSEEEDTWKIISEFWFQ